MAYSPLTNEFLVNTATAGSQVTPHVVRFSDGRILVTWGGPTTEAGTAFAIRGQFYSDGGTKIGGEIFLTDFTSRPQDDPEATPLPNGGFVLVWTNAISGGTIVKVQFFDAAGVETSPEFTLDSQASRPDVVALPNGSAIVVWAHVPVGSTDVFGTILAPNGARQDFTVNTTTLGNQFDPSVTLLSNGNFIVTWDDQESNGQDVKGQIFNSSGSKIGGEFLVNTITALAQTNSEIAPLASGGFVAVWQDGDPSLGVNNGDVRGQVFDANGAKVGAEFLVNTNVASGQFRPSAAATPNGGFVVTWTDESQTGGDSNSTSIKAQQFAADGTKIGPEFLVNTITQAAQDFSSIAALSNGDIFLTWTDASQTGGDSSGTGIRARIFTAATLGTENADVFTGTGGDDDFRGLGGSDTFYLQQGGNDRASGGDGDDTFYFGNAYTSADRIDGGAGNDRLILQGQYGNLQLNTLSLVNVETILLLTASNNAFGGAGASPTFYSITSVDANLAAGSSMLVDGRQLAANEYLNFNGSAESDGSFFLYGGAAVDTLTGGAGRDTLDGGAGNDTLAGGANDDIYFVDHPGDIVTEAVGGGSFDAVYTGVNYVLKAGSEVELLAATGLALGQAIALTGNELGQSLVSGSGHDDLNGGGGADFLIANAGNDSLNGGTGLDNMSGGAGDDIYFVDMLGDIVIELVGEGTDSVYASATYQLSGGAEVELLATTGLAPGQAITLFGNDFAQSIIGATGNDILYGFGGNDSLVGNEGADILDGGAGNDGLRGDAGADIFKFVSVADSTGAGDNIFDFLSGTDKIDLSEIDANTNVPGNHAFTFIGTNAFGGVAGQLRVESSGGLVNLLGDVDGDGNADLIIHLYNTGGVMPNAGDFVL